jgi:hypothetical protein
VAKVKQPYEERRFVPWLGREVDPGEVVDVPEGDLPSYLEAGWEPGDKATVKAAADLVKANEPAGSMPAGEGA